MKYRLHKRMRPFWRLRAVGLTFVFILGLSILATAYADLRAGDTISHFPAQPGRLVTGHETTATHKTGSAHARGQSTKSKQPNAALPAMANLQTASCTMFPPQHRYLSQAMTPELRKMAQYEQLCNGALFDRSSFFVPTPITVGEAQADAADVSSRLKEYAEYGIKPLVFMEPTSNGNNIDLAKYADGNYDDALDAYYAAIKAQGISDAAMGMWVLLPEGNLPEWSSVDPTIFAQVVTRTGQLQKKYFPASQLSLMLDSETYPSATSWDGGAYSSLVPYVRTIPKGLISSFGLQGFPWAAPASQGEEDYDPSVYLRLDLAEQAARALGTNSVWVNTGTFHEMYAGQAGRTVVATAKERQMMLEGVLREVKATKAQGFNVAIHLFAQNKGDTSEGTDWSYWQSQPGNDADTAVFTTFVHDAANAGIPLWLFDTN